MSADFESFDPEAQIALKQILGIINSMNQEIFDKIKGIIVDQLDVDADSVTPEANFISDLEADSLDTVELIMAFEEEFDIDIPDEVAEQITTVGEAVKIIDSKAGQVGFRTVM